MDFLFRGQVARLERASRSLCSGVVVGSGVMGKRCPMQKASAGGETSTAARDRGDKIVRPTATRGGDDEQEGPKGGLT